MRAKLTHLFQILACHCVGHRWHHFNHRAVDSASRSCLRCQRFEVADMERERWFQIK